MRKIQGPALFLAQFVRDEAPFDRIETLAEWVSAKGYAGVQIPTWDRRMFDLDTAAESQTYCDDYRGMLQEVGLQPTELAAHLQGQVLAIHPAYEVMFQPFYPDGLGDRERAEWAARELTKAIQASAKMGTDNIPVLSGGFAWHMVYPWPQRPAGIIVIAARRPTGFTRGRKRRSFQVLLPNLGEDTAAPLTNAPL
jgi:sugar phosphate isomerase/epimerase